MTAITQTVIKYRHTKFTINIPISPLPSEQAAYDGARDGRVNVREADQSPPGWHTGAKRTHSTTTSCLIPYTTIHSRPPPALPTTHTRYQPLGTHTPRRTTPHHSTQYTIYPGTIHTRTRPHYTSAHPQGHRTESIEMNEVVNTLNALEFEQNECVNMFAKCSGLEKTLISAKKEVTEVLQVNVLVLK